MLHENIPIAIAEFHADMRDLHVPAGVVNRPACACAKVVDKELLFPGDTIVSPVLPESPQLGIGFEPWQEVVREGGNSVIASETLL